MSNVNLVGIVHLSPHLIFPDSLPDQSVCHVHCVANHADVGTGTAPAIHRYGAILWTWGSNFHYIFLLSLIVTSTHNIRKTLWILSISIVIIIVLLESLKLLNKGHVAASVQSLKYLDYREPRYMLSRPAHAWGRERQEYQTQAPQSNLVQDPAQHTVGTWWETGQRQARIFAQTF